MAAATSFFPLTDFEIFTWNMSLEVPRVKGLENASAFGAISPASLLWLLWSCKKPQIFFFLCPLVLLQAYCYFSCILLNLVFHFCFTFLCLQKFFPSFFGATPSFLTGLAGLPFVSIATGLPPWGVSDCPFTPAIYIHKGRELEKKKKKLKNQTGITKINHLQSVLSTNIHNCIQTTAF